MIRPKTVLVVGGSHSVHVCVPATMIRQAGYRVVLGDLQEQTAPEAGEMFDAVYPLVDPLLLTILKARPKPPEGKDDTGFGSTDVEQPRRWRPYLWRLFRDWRQAGQLRRVVCREHPGVIHFQSMSAGGMVAYYLLQRMGWPARQARPGLMAHLWGFAPRFPGIRRREIRVLKEFDQLHSSSPAVARIYRENFEVPPEQIQVFVRGINLETFAPRGAEALSSARAAWGVPADRFVIIHNRHLHPMYRVDVAADAFIELARRGHGVFLLLVRGGMRQESYEKDILARLARAGLGDRVALLPPVLTPEEMALALQLSHCCVNCVPFDAFPVSILEAMYCRSVPVVRNLESYSQFVREGQTAFAIDGEAGDYADRIERLIVEPALREGMAQAGVDLVASIGSEEIFRRNTLDLVERCWHEW